MSKIVHICCCLTFASNLISSALLAQQPPNEDGLIFPDEFQPVDAFPLPATIEAPAFDARTTATLHVVVDDGATVLINDRPTHQQPSGGIRHFALAQLDPLIPCPTIVKVRLLDGSMLQCQEFMVVAENDYTVWFPSIAAGAVVMTGPLMTAGIMPSPMVGPMEDLQNEATRLSDSVQQLEEAVSQLNTWQADLEASSASLTTAKGEIKAANEQFRADLETAQGALEEAVTEHLETARTALGASANELTSQLATSTQNLKQAETKLVESTQKEAENLKALVDRLAVVVNPLVAIGPGDRVYRLEPKESLQATLSYNEALEVSGINFDASQLKDTITFLDDNHWNSQEVARGGELTLRLQVRLNGGDPVDFMPSEKRDETVQYESHTKRRAQIPFAQDVSDNLKTWIEETVKKNTDQTEKLGHNDNVTAVLITGEFKLGFADAVRVAQPLEIKILK